MSGLPFWRLGPPSTNSSDSNLMMSIFIRIRCLENKHLLWLNYIINTACALPYQQNLNQLSFLGSGPNRTFVAVVCLCPNASVITVCLWCAEKQIRHKAFWMDATTSGSGGHRVTAENTCSQGWRDCKITLGRHALDRCAQARKSLNLNWGNPNNTAQRKWHKSN